MAASAYFETVQKIYIAFYQRPADPAGLKYWATEIDKAGGNPNAVITAFGTSDEAQELYGDIDADTIGGVIDAVYQAAFGRAAEPEEIDYWAEGFNAGTITASSMALAVVLGAQNDDLATIDNKLEVANEFTAQVDGRPLTDAGFGTGPFAATYEGNDDAVSARDVLVNVTADPASIPAAEDITTFIQDTIADEGDPIVEPEPTTFALTAEGISVDEGQSIAFTVEASQPVEVDTVFTFAVGSTSATAADFTGPTAGTVTILAGETSATFSVTVAADNVAELAEGFTVTLKDADGVVVATESVDINDVTVDLTAPVVTAGQVFSYAENQAAGATVGTVAATDAVGVTEYAIASGNDAGFFAIDAATGKITLTAAGAAAGAAANDFETTPNAFTLGVTATDDAGNVSAAADVVINVTNVDDDAPVLSAATSSTNKVVLAFNEALSTTSGVPAAAAFTGTQNVGGTVTNLNVTGVAISGSTVELTLGTAIPAGATIALTYTQPATAPLVDAAGNKVATFTGQAVTVDTTAPTLASSTPADDAANVAVGSNIVLTFSETVKAGTGNITIVNSANAADTRTISVTDSTQVTVSGNTVTINPTLDLLAAASYYVNVAPTALTDSLGNAFAGISSQTTLNFATPGGGGTAGKIIALTQGADTVNTTTANTALQSSAGDDTINAFLDGGSATFSGSLDSVDGGGGIDTLVAYGQTGANNLTNVTNVEVITVRTGAAVASVDVSTAAGFTALTGAKLVNQGSANALDFLKIGSTTPTLVVQGATADAGFVHTAAAVGSGADTANIEVDGYKPTGDGIGEAASDGNGVVLVAGIENLNVKATGAESSFKIFTDNATDGSVGDDTNGYASATTLNVTGSAKVTIGHAMTGLKTINMSQNTGGVSVDNTAGATVLTVTGGSGNDTLTITAANLDKTAATKDTINLGDGTGDVLALDATAINVAGWTAFVDAANAVVSNTEGLRFGGKSVNNASAELTSIDLNVFTNGIKNFTFNAASATGVDGSANVAVTGLVTANTLTFNENVTGNTGATAGDNAVSIAGLSAGQTANIALAGATIAGGAQNGGASAGGNAFAFGAGVSKVVITSNSDSASNTNAIAAGADAAAGITAAFGANPADFELKGATTITIKGDDGGNASAAFANAVNFNATAFTGTSTIHLSDSATGDVFTGGSGIDNVFGWAGDDNLSGNAGADVLNGGAGKDTLNGGDGDDILVTAAFPAVATGGASAENLTGGNGTDKFYLAQVNVKTTTAANILANAYVITDFNASGEKLYLSSVAGGDATESQHMLGDVALSDKAWNATTGIVATDSQVVNIGTLAAVTGKTNLVDDLLDMLVATTAAPGKIATAVGAEFVVVFNSARDGATYAAIINDDATAGFAIADDNMTLVKLTGVAVADLSAADFALAATGVWGA